MKSASVAEPVSLERSVRDARDRTPFDLLREAERAVRSGYPLQQAQFDTSLCGCLSCRSCACIAAAREAEEYERVRPRTVLFLFDSRSSTPV
ncbi:MAG: hypothetical protein DWQ34_17855 [Planctomycetota bacterium]|nr:MAG: hypothetical protein DWQ29_10475 [Planctomycetota bacterium]REJ90228.1 MAG: hypothetical protein DWQ34_17855 [Planctomycetota bacterium]REK20830.1 MAG: hypothetical protein DWQ41_23590 [Planctomycetota bacterium]REK36057.1 MAG: hypothetical protein DWQ45_10250 [Planctomycetota bacterium]